MDVVITYVDGTDQLWKRDFLETTGREARPRRYRDWGTLQFLLRGLDKHLKGMGKLFLVVARESQVPGWIDRSQVEVVLHEDIIPKELLPTFNSTTIELFLHRIPGLSERFLYFNDDCFLLEDACEEDFFPGGLPATGFARHLFAGNLYKKQVRRSDVLACKALGKMPPLLFLRPQHSCLPCLRRAGEELFERIGPEIMASLTTLREPQNPNFYIFLDYLRRSGRAKRRRLDSRHISLQAVSPEVLRKAIAEPRAQLLCLGDVEMGPERYQKLRNAMMVAFMKRYHDVSRFEKY